MTNFDSKSFIKTLPEKPGVYQMYGADKELLYVGKAVNLKNRVSSYFKNTVKGKTRHLVNQINSLEFIVTSNETEALLLEANLIKSHRPKYNVLLRDDKSYPFILLSNDEFPRLSLYRGKKIQKKNGRLFGPFPNSQAVKETIDLLVKVFKIRTCQNGYFKNRSRPCLEHQIKRCTAPCVNKIGAKAYQENVEQAVLFLNGKKDFLIRLLEEKMQKESQALHYEKAMHCRDKLKAIYSILQNQSVSVLKGDLDVVALVYERGILMGSVVSLKQGEVMNASAYQMQYAQNLKESMNEGADLNNFLDEALYAFLVQYYLGSEKVLPREILVPPLKDLTVLQSALYQRDDSIKLRQASRGFAKKWVELAYENATTAIDVLERDESVISSRLRNLQDALSLPEPIKRIECFDISHIQGAFTVASCVVYTTSGATNREYRTYNITDVTKGDDYAAMRQVLRRRYKKTDSSSQRVLPDLILIDGGLGQLNVAEGVCRELNLEVCVVGVAKGPSRKSGVEQLLPLPNKKPLSLPKNSPARHLIQFIRDESHRVAISAHRKKRGKTMSFSILNDIDGIGPKKQQQLIKRFASITGLKRATIEDIVSLPGFSHQLAKKIKLFFDNQF